MSCRLGLGTWRSLSYTRRGGLRVCRSQGSWLVCGQLLPTFPRGLRIIRSTSRASSHLFAYPFAQLAHITLVTQRGRPPQIARTSPDTLPWLLRPTPTRRHLLFVLSDTSSIHIAAVPSRVNEVNDGR